MAITFSKPSQPIQEQLPSQDFGSFERRIRTLEESVTNLRKIVQVTEENILIKSRHNSTEFKSLISDLNELRRENRELREKMLMMIKDLGSVARAEDVKVLERYISLWNPVKFVSQNEVENLVDDIISRRARKAQQGNPEEQQ